MHKNKWCQWTWVWCALGAQAAWAQSASPSVSDLIDTIKMQREMALTPSLKGSRFKSPPSTASAAPARPLLWSVTGVNEDYSAVVVVDRKAYTVRSMAIPQRVGRWTVDRVSAHAVCLSQGGQRHCLDAPHSASSVYPFVNALPPAPSAEPAFAVSTPPVPAPAPVTGNEGPLPESLAASLASLPVSGGLK